MTIDREKFLELVDVVLAECRAQCLDNPRDVEAVRKVAEAVFDARDGDTQLAATMTLVKLQKAGHWS